MESLACRSPRACAACPHSTRQGACLLEEQVDLALEAVAPRPLVVVAARRALA
jgi:hypothetical protein